MAASINPGVSREPKSADNTFEMNLIKHNGRPQPRGRRGWNVGLAALLIILAVGVVTVRAARRPSTDDRVFQPTDPGIVTHHVGAAGK